MSQAADQKLILKAKLLYKNIYSYKYQFLLHSVAQLFETDCATVTNLLQMVSVLKLTAIGILQAVVEYIRILFEKDPTIYKCSSAAASGQSFKFSVESLKEENVHRHSPFNFSCQNVFPRVQDLKWAETFYAHSWRSITEIQIYEDVLKAHTKALRKRLLITDSNIAFMNTLIQCELSSRPVCFPSPYQALEMINAKSQQARDVAKCKLRYIFNHEPKVAE